MIINQTQEKKVHPRQMISYRAFRDRFHTELEKEAHLFEKFYAIRLLVEEGYTNIFIDVILDQHTQNDVKQRVVVDVCGELNGKLMAALCQMESPTTELYEKLMIMRTAKNIKVIIICPNTIKFNALITSFGEQFDSGKFFIEPITWLSDEPTRAFKEVMELVPLLGNFTRIRMLLPLLIRAQKKRHYRLKINPKLIYENLPTLIEHKLIDELSDNEYSLTPIGREILLEYLTFLQNLKKVTETIEKEVNRNGLG